MGEREEGRVEVESRAYSDTSRHYSVWPTSSLLPASLTPSPIHSHSLFPASLTPSLCPPFIHSDSLPHPLSLPPPSTLTSYPQLPSYPPSLPTPCLPRFLPKPTSFLRSSLPTFPCETSHERQASKHDGVCVCVCVSFTRVLRITRWTRDRQLLLLPDLWVRL